MIRNHTLIPAGLLAGLLLAVLPVHAEAPKDFLARFEQTARSEASAFSGFSAQRGADFFKARHGGDWSCSTCHTGNPAARGQHAVTAKAIDPLAPAANPERFTSTRQVDKWFKRNCNDVLNRPCTATEKGDVLAYLLSIGK